MDAKELVAHLNAHFAMIGQAIEAEGGIIDKYVGDAVVAIFGALVPLPNHAAAAMRPRSRCRNGSAPRRARRGDQDPHRPQHRQLYCRQRRLDQPRDQLHRDRRFRERRGAPRSREQGTRTSILASEINGARRWEGFLTRSLGAIRVKGRVESVTVHELIGLNTA